MRMISATRIRRAARREDGFTMLFALMALFVGTLLVAAAFTAATGDIGLTHTDTNQKKAYYAALAGINEYTYQLNANPNYWIKCPSTSEAKVPGTSDETYSVKTLPATGHPTCESEKQATIIETAGSATGTFRIESTGTVGSGSKAEKRSIVATYTHPGFLNYVYFTNYEVEDPANFSPEPVNCEHYYKVRVEKGYTGECGTIQFAPKDKVNGPMHTNDAAAICSNGEGSPTFGRTSADKIEMNEGHYAAGGCSNTPNIVGTYTELAPTLLPPETDNELLSTAGDKFRGKTVIELKSGSPNTMTVTTEGKPPEPMPFPANGVVFVENTSCTIKYSPFGSDYKNDSGCGNVYVSGTYSESLTIAAANDVIIKGNLETTSEAGSTPSGKPTGGATLGLIATNFVRIYHPVDEGEEVGHYTPNLLKAFGAKGETCLPVKYTGTTTNGSTSVTSMSSVEGLEVGDEVSGTGIAAGSTISRVETNKIVLNNKATASGTVTLTFTLGLGYAYHSGVAGTLKCVEKGKTGYTYHESENLYTLACPAGSTYSSEGFCEWENTTNGCSSKATNLNSTQDTLNHWGVLSSPVIDAAILSTHHSFIVDNYKCGALLGELKVWGSIAQFWRGPVGTAGGSGYIKSYNYDDRLASEQPPNFLSPTSTSWHLTRETAPPNGFG